MYTLRGGGAPISFSLSALSGYLAETRGVQAGKGGMGRLGVANTISVMALMLRLP